MTLSDHMHATEATGDHRNERVARGVGVALAKCLRHALEQGRLTTGIWASAMLLQSAPERVLVCVLPEMECESDHALHIHHTLITAFCWEHGIRLLRVAGHDLKVALAKLTDGSRNDNGVRENGVSSCVIDHEAAPLCVRDKGVKSLCVKDSGVMSSCVSSGGGPDVSCLLIEHSSEAMSFEEEVVLDFHDDVMYNDVFPKPVLHLPG